MRHDNVKISKKKFTPEAGNVIAISGGVVPKGYFAFLIVIPNHNDYDRHITLNYPYNSNKGVAPLGAAFSMYVGRYEVANGRNVFGVWNTLEDAVTDVGTDLVYNLPISQERSKHWQKINLLNKTMELYEGNIIEVNSEYFIITANDGPRHSVINFNGQFRSINNTDNITAVWANMDDFLKDSK